jgi:HlyD family secretion protein
VPVPGAPSANQQGSPLSALMPQMRRRPGASGGQQGAVRRLGRAWILENGAPALVMFRPGASDGRMTQVLDHDPASRLPSSLANNEQFRQALARKLEPGMKVIVDEAAQP